MGPTSKGRGEDGQGKGRRREGMEKGRGGEGTRPHLFTPPPNPYFWIHPWCRPTVQQAKC